MITIPTEPRILREHIRTLRRSYNEAHDRGDMLTKIRTSKELNEAEDLLLRIVGFDARRRG